MSYPTFNEHTLTLDKTFCTPSTGQTYIGKNVTLDAGNIINDSIVADDAYVIASCLNKSKVKRGQKVGPFVKLDGEVVGD